MSNPIQSGLKSSFNPEINIPNNYCVAVLIPCFNEELTITQVIYAFKTILPEAKIYVYDNCSTDRTAEVATLAGAIVRFEPNRGKGNVVRRMFADIEADIYVMIDGDDTYEVSASTRMIKRLLDQNLDMVVGVRKTSNKNAKVYRRGHKGGNLFLTTIVKYLFRCELQDMLSGYRVFSRRFVKSFPSLSTGFEIETELTIHTLELKIPFVEEPILHYARPSGSLSKLKTFSDGWRILGTAILMFKEIRPFIFFSIFFAIFFIISLSLGLPIIFDFLETGLVRRFPTAILSASLMILAITSLSCGLILNVVSRGRKEVKRLFYLSHKPLL
jgi:glycosyltransferase involved in cell wall biosynthesis